MLMKRHQRIAPLFTDEFLVTRRRSQEEGLLFVFVIIKSASFFI